MNYNIVFGIIVVYFSAILGSLVCSRYRATGSIMPGLEEFFLARRSLPTPVLVLTFIGSLFSAFTVVGIPGSVYKNGIGGMLFVLVGCFLALPLVTIFGMKVRKYAADHGSVSPIGLLRRSYDSTALGVIATLMFVVFLSPYLSLQLVGLGKLLQGISAGEITYMTGVGGVLMIVLMYVLFGGMRAVAYTDVVQSVVIFVGMIMGVLMLVYGIWGGFTELFTAVNKVSPEHLSLPGPEGLYTTPMFISYVMVISMIFITPHIVTRYMMASDDNQIKAITKMTALASAVAFIPGLLFGLMAVVLHPDLESSNMVGGIIFHDLTQLGIWGVVAATMLLIGVLGASMSTADSILLSISQMITRDVVRPFVEISRPMQVLLARGVMVLLLGFAFVIGMEPPEVMIDLALYANKGAGLFIPLYAGLWWSKRNKYGAIASVTVGALVLFYLGLNGIKPLGFDGAVFAWLTSAVIYVASGYLLPQQVKKVTA